MNIHKTISEFYIKAAEIICNSACHKCCAAKCKCKMNVDVFGDKDTSAIPDMFYSMLDDIAADIGGNSDIDVQPYGEYYRGTDIIDWDGIIANAERTLSGKISKCKHSDDSQKRLVEKTAQKLAGKVGVRRIAEIIFYKENHRFYDKIVESEYTEVVKAVAQSGNDILSKRMYKKVQKTTSEITFAAAQQVYESVYDKSVVKDKYKLSWEQFVSNVDDIPYYFDATPNSNKHSIKPQYEGMLYYKNTKKRKEEKNFKSWSSCFKDVESKISISENTYLKFVWYYIPDLLGINNTYIEYFYGNYNGEYVAKTISNELNDIIIVCNNLFLKHGKKRKYSSAFMLIDSIDDVIDFNYIAETFMQMIALRLEPARYDKFLTTIDTGYSTARKEVTMLTAAANSFYK